MIDGEKRLSENSGKKKKEKLNCKKIDKYFYNLSDIIGSGSFGKVYLGKEDSGEKVAVKVLDLRAIESEESLVLNLANEIKVMKSLMKTLNSPHIVRIHDIVTTSNNIYIFQEYCKDGDLRSFMKKRKHIAESEAIKILQDILCGFLEMKHRGIIHRDLKPENILINDGIYKIGDFGFAKIVDDFGNDTLKSLVGTPLYMAPQILKNQTYSAKSDVWSVGLIFYELLYGKTPWKAKNVWELVNSIFSEKLEFPQVPAVSSLVKSFITHCLKIEESQRFSWDDVFSHKLFDDCFHYRKRMTQLEEKSDKFFKTLKSLHHDKLEKITDEFLKARDRESFSRLAKKVDPECELEEIDYYFNKSTPEFIAILLGGANSAASLYAKSHSLPHTQPSGKTPFGISEKDNIRSLKKLEEIKEKFVLLSRNSEFDFEQMFWTFDSRGDHTLDLVGFTKLMQTLDKTLTKIDIYDLFQFFDTKKRGEISKEEFKKVINLSERKRSDTKEEPQKGVFSPKDKYDPWNMYTQPRDQPILNNSPVVINNCSNNHPQNNIASAPRATLGHKLTLQPNQSDENHFTAYETKVRQSPLMAHNNDHRQGQASHSHERSPSLHELLNKECYKLLRAKLSGNKLIFNAIQERSSVFTRYEFEEFSKNIDTNLQPKEIGDLFLLLDHEKKGKIFIEDLKKIFY